VVAVSVTSEFEHAVQVLGDVALPHRMAEGDLDEQDVRGCRQGAAGAQLLGASRTTVEAWKTEGVLVSAQQRLRHEVSMDDDLGELGGVLTAPACSRSVDDQEPRGWGRSPRSGPYHALASASLALASALRPPK
jgi:hypothetical protein